MDFVTSPTRYLFFTGKGGVGKTSLACATAVAMADVGRRVLLVSTDPASNLDDVFGMRLTNEPTAVPGVPGLAAVNVDPEAAAKAYRDRVVGPYRGVLPADAVAHMEEQLSGSCTVEIAAFDEFTGLLTNNQIAAKYEHIIFDTAPTGHTLLLLDATGSYHREMMRQMSKARPADAVRADSDGHVSIKGVSTPMMKLQDPAYTKVIIVTLAENTPVLEASRLQDDLRRAQIEPYAWVINSSLSATTTTDPLLRARAMGELAMIEDVRDRRAARTFIVPWQAEPPVGAASLHGLIGAAT